MRGQLMKRRYLMQSPCGGREYGHSRETECLEVKSEKKARIKPTELIMSIEMIKA